MEEYIKQARELIMRAYDGLETIPVCGKAVDAMAKAKSELVLADIELVKAAELAKKPCAAVEEVCDAT